MTQPDYVPITSEERVRAVRRLPAPAPWWADRPADLNRPDQPEGPSLGVPGPDQGYALTLAQRFERRLVLTEGEHAEDAVQGCAGVALRRASLYDRAPVIYDLEHAYRLFGFLGDPPADLVAWRRGLFNGVSHDYWARRRVADLVPEQVLALTPERVSERIGEWRSLLGLGAEVATA